MSDFVLDLAVEAKRFDGVWVETDNPDLMWYGCRFKVKPATTQLAEKADRIRRLSGKDGRNVQKFTRAMLDDLLVDAEGLGVGEREATLDEVKAYFSQVPAFVAWLIEKSMEAAVKARQEVEAELGN